MKSFGLLSVSILVCGLLFLVLRWPQDKNTTFSKHAAAQRLTMYYYVLLFAVTLPLLLLFFINWFVPTFHLSGWFTACVVVSSILQFSVTLVPDVGGWKSRYHGPATALSAVLLLPPLAMLLTVSRIGGVSKPVVLAGLVVMLAIGVFSRSAVKKQRHLLLLQASYYAAFFAAILTVTYAR